MTETFTGFSIWDVRFPTSIARDGSDATNPAPDYSLAYLMLHTSSGDQGHGFTFTLGRGTEIVTAALRAFEPLIRGLPVADTLADMASLSRRLLYDSPLRWLGPAKGVINLAAAAIINAAWDLSARRCGKPLWRLLCDMTSEQLVDLVDFTYLEDVLTRDEALQILREGEPNRATRIAELQATGIRAYTTSIGWAGYADDKVARLTRAAVAAGFDHVKLKVGLSSRENVRRAHLVRDIIGPNRALSVDANQCWSVKNAAHMINDLAPVRPYWVEEPTSPDDIAGHVAITQSARGIRIASGEHVANSVVFKQLLARRAIAVCQIDACRLAGVTEDIAVILMAAKFGVPVCPHTGGVGLGEVAQHLSMFDYVCIGGPSDTRWLEYISHLHDQFVDPVNVQGGRYRAPSDAGSGGELTQAALRTFGRRS